MTALLLLLSERQTYVLFLLTSVECLLKSATELCDLSYVLDKSTRSKTVQTHIWLLQ